MSLAAIVRHYRKHFRPQAQAELDWFRDQPTFETALEYAALATDRDRSRFSHQHRLKRKDLEKAYAKLLASAASIREQKNFARMYERISAILDFVEGVGPLYRYDTSLRLGAYLNKMPAAVYLRNGTRQGAIALGLDGNVRALYEVPWINEPSGESGNFLSEYKVSNEAEPFSRSSPGTDSPLGSV